MQHIFVTTFGHLAVKYLYAEFVANCQQTLNFTKGREQWTVLISFASIFNLFSANFTVILECLFFLLRTKWKN